MANSIPRLDLSKAPGYISPSELSPVEKKSSPLPKSPVEALKQLAALDSPKRTLSFIKPTDCTGDCTSCEKSDCTYVFKGIYPDEVDKRSTASSSRSPSPGKPKKKASLSPKLSNFGYSSPRSD